MKFILLFTLLVTVKTQTQTQTITPTQKPTWSPSTTPMGSPMFAYPLSFPNSDPTAATRQDRLVYLMTAIACSANVPAELVWISYIRADNKIVTFNGPPHTIIGLVQNCSTLVPPPFLPNESVLSMLVVFYYLSPRPANPKDILFYTYASSIAVTPNITYVTGDANTNQLSAGGVAGIVIGVLAAAAVSISICIYLMCFRTKKQPMQIQAPRNSLHEFKRVKKVTLPTVTVR